MVAELQVVGPTYDRKRYLGSSDIAGVMGISPWISRLGVWQKKTEDAKPPSDSAQKKKLYNRGKVWESVVASMLVAELEANDHKVTILNANQRYVDATMDFCAAEIDFEIKLDDIPDIVNVELKTVSPFAAAHWGESMSDEVPLWYAAQGMFGLMVTGRKCCVLAPLFGADEVRIFPIVRDEETIAGMRQHADVFWNQHVIPKIAPEPIDLADVDRLFKQSAETIVTAEPYVVDLLMEWRAADAQAEASTVRAEWLEYQIKKYMRDATALILPGHDKPVVTWKTQKSLRLNIEKVKEMLPKVFKEFAKESTSRPFRVVKTQLGGYSE